MAKKLSIITVNFNNSAGLIKTAESICKSISQNDNLEWIIIDGGSTDSSLDIINDYAQFVHYWVSEPDEGVFHAMNKGLFNALGEYVIFMNSGDCFVNGLLSKSFIEELRGDVFYGDLFLSDGSMKKLMRQPDYPDIIYMLGRTLCHQSLFIKTQLCRKYPFRTDFNLIGDWIQLFSILKNENVHVVYYPKPICYYDGNGMSDRFVDDRNSQRINYLRSIYSNWELTGYRPLTRLRGRKYYDWVLSTLDSWKRQFILRLITKLC